MDKEVEIDKISGFVYGAFSTRFWMMRIGINDKIADHIDKGSEKSLEMPFYAW